MQFFALSDSFLCPRDCGSAVRVRIGWISCQVTFQELFFIALTYHCLCLGDRRGRFGRSYRSSSFGGRCTYAVYFWCMECVLTSNCMRLLDRAPVCMGGEVYFAYRVFVPASLWNPRAAVGLAAGQGGPVCMHPSRSLGAVPGPRRIHGFLTLPDLCCPRCEGPMDPVRAGSRLPLHYRRATSPHPTLPYPTGPTIPCLPLHHAHSPLCVPDLTYLSVSVSLLL